MGQLRDDELRPLLPPDGGPAGRLQGVLQQPGGLDGQQEAQGGGDAGQGNQAGGEVMSAVCSIFSMGAFPYRHYINTARLRRIT